MKIKGILSCLSNACNLKKKTQPTNNKKINKNCGQGVPFEPNHTTDSCHMAFFSTPHPKEKGCGYKYPVPGYPGVANYPALLPGGEQARTTQLQAAFPSYGASIRSHGSALCVFSHPKTSGEGNGQVAAQRHMPILAWEKIKQTQHA